ncbi:hypothetical protein Pta02_61110 [Planobispora takensis]|uniref:SecDF P1 head subdomain domain-containing protein n=2 Tax=Planobispora takensis TaxID=1367882 RepID=A0A8J3WWS0_9ACTN|nr:hypothetical protein Pta02_61110 [Planobispora takensis]
MHKPLPAPRRTARWIVALAVVVVVAGAAAALVMVNRSAAEPAAADKPPFTLATPVGFRPVLEIKEIADDSPCTGEDLPDRDGSLCYRLAEGMTIRQARDVRAEELPDIDEWALVITFAPADSAAFGELSGRAAGQPDPGNKVAIVVDGVVLSAGTVTSAITDGAVQLSGAWLTQESSTALVRRLTRAPVPGSEPLSR